MMWKLVDDFSHFCNIEDFENVSKDPEVSIYQSMRKLVKINLVQERKFTSCEMLTTVYDYNIKSWKCKIARYYLCFQGETSK